MKSEMGTDVVLALGSNLGDRAAILRSAVTAIDKLEEFHVTRVSEIYASAALTQQGISDTEPEYLNLVLLGQCSTSAGSLLTELQSIELKHGRQRGKRWAARTLDIDIVKFGDITANDPALTIPHPEASRRAFVVMPWLSIQPDASLPGLAPLRELAVRFNTEVRIYEGA